jgi:hypothetical protein
VYTDIQETLEKQFAAALEQLLALQQESLGKSVNSKAF